MNSNILSPRVLLGVILAITFSASVYALDNVESSSAANEVLKLINSPQYKNDTINNPRTQNDTELVMFILKAIEEKKIQDPKQKIAFTNSFQVSDDIKGLVINQINQNLNYSDNERVAYGIYMLKKCNKRNASSKQVCYVDRVPKPAPNCVYQRSNVCCVNKSV